MAMYSFGVLSQDPVPTFGSGAMSGVFEPSVGKGTLTAKNCAVMWGRTYVDFGKKTVSVSSGTVYAKLTHPTSSSASPTLELTTSGDKSDGKQTVFPLYKVSDGRVTVDYRNIPWIPVYT